MVDISIHNVNNINIEKYKLDSGIWVYNLEIICQAKMAKEQSHVIITLFAENKKIFNNIKI